MLTQDYVDTIASFPLFGPVPRAELEWMAARADIDRHPADTILREIGAVIDHMWIVLAGRLAVQVERSGARRNFHESGPGEVIGAMPFSRMRIAPARLAVEEDTTLCSLSRSYFADLVRDCPELTSALVHQLLDRSRDFRTAEMHDDRMLSLGRLAAGLAHELNNPASGATSHARSLGASVADLEIASRALARAHLTDEQIECVDALRRMCTDAAQPKSPLEMADREDEFSEWLLAHGVDPTAASTLATANVSLGALDHLADVLPSETLGVAVGWAASLTSVREGAAQIMAATERIHALVNAVKGFTFMDRERVREEVNIARGLADTVAMLENKSRSKPVRVQVETAEELPGVFGFGSELNQVWEKLIDNAIDAARVGGNVSVIATRRGDFVVVRVMDDGPGIPEEHRARIFDPFFTTKPVGLGTGLGLDIARRFTHLNDGDLDFTSQSGHTVFRVRLPVSGTNASARGVK